MKRPGITRDRIINTAIELADSEGVERISMRRISGELGVQAMSLYNHVQGKEDILDGLVERVVEEMGLPDPVLPWKKALEHRAHSAHSVLVRHPWAIQLLLTRENAGPMMLRYVDATLKCLIDAGFSYEVADHAWNTMDNHIYGYTLQKVNFPFEEDDYARTAGDFLPGIPQENYPYFTALATMIYERRYSGIHSLDFGLNFILDGLERMLESGLPLESG